MSSERPMHGWIDDVDDGIVWGRVTVDGREMEFHVPLLLVEEGQRVDLQPGSYCSIINGELLIDKTIYTTHDMEQADERARQLYQKLGWS